MLIPQTSFLVLYTADVARTHDFYSQLGAVIKERAEDKVVVSFGDFDLHFVLYSAEPNSDYAYKAAPQQYGQGVLLYSEVSSLSEAKEKVLAAGGIIKADIFANHWGYQELLFEDPNGYAFAVYAQA